MDMVRLGEIARRHGVCLIVQHGSTVSGQVHARSDFDLAVLFEDGRVSFAETTALIEDLQACVPGRDVDVAVMNNADPLFLKKILEHGRLLHGSTRAFAELKMYAFRRYQDHKRFLTLERLYVTRAVKRAVAS